MIGAQTWRPTLVQGGKTISPGFAVIAYGKLGSLELGYTRTST